MSLLLQFRCPCSLGALCPFYIFFGKHFILFGRSPLACHAPISPPLADVFDFAKCALEIWFRLQQQDEGCTSAMCHPVQAHIEHTHIRRHRHAPSAHLPPTLLGLCPAGDAQCHMCSVWRHKWRQIALTLILIPIPNRIRIRILAHHILSFNYHRRIIAFSHGSWWLKESPDIGDEV